jgi:hypothetical protein
MAIKQFRSLMKEIPVIAFCVLVICLAGCAQTSNSTTSSDNSPVSTPITQPRTFSNHGSQITESFYLSQGPHQVSLTVGPQYYTTIILEHNNGDFVAPLVNSIGFNYTGTPASINIAEAGYYVLDVRTQGDWSITIN